MHQHQVASTRPTINLAPPNKLAGGRGRGGGGGGGGRGSFRGRGRGGGRGGSYGGGKAPGATIATEADGTRDADKLEDGKVCLYSGRGQKEELIA